MPTQTRFGYHSLITMNILLPLESCLLALGDVLPISTTSNPSSSFAVRDKEEDHNVYRVWMKWILWRQGKDNFKLLGRKMSPVHELHNPTFILKGHAQVYVHVRRPYLPWKSNHAPCLHVSTKAHICIAACVCVVCVCVCVRMHM